MKSINPYNNRIVFNHEELDSTEIETKITTAHNAFLSWRELLVKKRALYFERIANLLEKNAEEWGKTITLEMGKPISQSIAEINKCAWVCKYYAQKAEHFLSPNMVETDAKESYVKFSPLGVILGVMPWNYPFWQVFRFAVPTIIAGNTVLVKHASNVMESARLIEDIFNSLDFPVPVYQNLAIKSDKVAPIIRNKYVKGVSLTGSKNAGSAVASVAGEEIKPSLLELGGSNALAVFPDSDTEQTANIVVNARYQNSGQSCIAGKRLIVHEDIAPDFLAKLMLKIKALKVGDPMDTTTEIGPLARVDLAKELENQLEKSVKMGAEIILGGKRKDAFFEPTLVKNVTPEMPIFKEETFGPLLSCTTFKTDEEALELINQSAFGLGASIFTHDSDRIYHFTMHIEDGAVFVNDLVKSDPRLPFGGTGISGYGRELAKEGIRAFCNNKTVYIAKEACPA